MKLLLATNNAGKLEEMQVLLRSESVELLVPRDLGISLDVAETGSSYLENATLKARAFAQASGLLALADDSGLEVDALGGKPGLYSARFAPQEGANDADRRAYLVEQLLSFPQPWQARFVSVIVLAKPQGTLRDVQGSCHGVIIPEERGSNGFGYDPIFFIPEMGKTMAELSMEEKNQISHRARAMGKAIPFLHQTW